MSEVDLKPVKKYYDYISVGNRTKQAVYFVEQHDKLVHFELFFKENPLDKTVVICRGKKSADSLSLFLKEQNQESITVHGNHRASQIEAAAVAFNSANAGVLITTSKIYETLALDRVDRVLYYELPFEPESYFKTLRAVDERGESILFVNTEDETMLETLELMMKYNIPQLEIEAFTHTALPKVEHKQKKKPRHKKSKKTKQEIKKEE
jgi:superfamily II DNA/RNA helicase